MNVISLMRLYTFSIKYISVPWKSFQLFIYVIWFSLVYTVLYNKVLLLTFSKHQENGKDTWLFCRTDYYESNLYVPLLCSRITCSVRKKCSSIILLFCFIWQVDPCLPLKYIVKLVLTEAFHFLAGMYTNLAWHDTYFFFFTYVS